MPDSRANGRAVRELFQSWSGNAAFDDTFVANVAAVRDIASAELDDDPWREE